MAQPVPGGPAPGLQVPAAADQEPAVADNGAADNPPRQQRRRRGTIFAVTLPLTLPVDPNCRQRALASVRQFRLPAGYNPRLPDPPIADDDIGQPPPDGTNPVLETFVVAKESYHNSVSGLSHHLHLFLRYKIGFHVERLRRFLVLQFPNLSIHVQPCKSEKAWISYITKSDEIPYHNTSQKYFALAPLVYAWAQRTRVFRYKDPFVSQHVTYVNYLRKYLAEENSERAAAEIVDFSFHPVATMPDVPWTRVVGEWWNRFISTVGHKRPHLYLYGPPNMGKSTLIHDLILSLPGLATRVYVPDIDTKFAWGSLDPNLHRVILMDETDLAHFGIATLKLLLDGRPFRANIKGAPGIMITWPHPVIMISNYNPQQRYNPVGMMERLLLTHADVPWFDAPLIPIPRWYPEDPQTPHIRNIHQFDPDLPIPVAIAEHDLNEAAPNAVSQQGTTYPTLTMHFLHLCSNAYYYSASMRSNPQL